MTDPTRLRLLKNLTAVLEGITVTNGYAHDLDGKVFRGRTLFSDDDPMPMVAILEAIEQQAPVRSDPREAMSNSPWELMIQGFAVDDRKNPTDPAHLLMADVKKAIALHKRNDPRSRDLLGMGGRVTDLKISPGVVRPADERSSHCYFWLKLSVSLVEDMADPYA